MTFTGIRINFNTIGYVIFKYLTSVFFVICLLVAFSLMSFSLATVECDVTGVSMQPTLNKLSGDKCDVVYIENFKNLQYKDIVVIDTPDNAIIKRVIGLPGDLIDIKHCEDGLFRIERNGEIIYEDYLKIDASVGTYNQNGMQNSLAKFMDLKERRPELFDIKSGKLKVGENQVFALGDNRHQSHDSTYYGNFDFSIIRGRVSSIRYYGESELEYYFNFVASGNSIKYMLSKLM